MRNTNENHTLKRTRALFAALWLALSLAGCRGPVHHQVALSLEPGAVDVVWVAAGRRVYRCVDTPDGPVCEAAQMNAKSRRK